MTSESDNRALWLTPYQNLQGRLDTRIRTILIDTAQDAEKQVIALGKKKTFSNAVRIAQLRLLMEELAPILQELFDDVKPVVSNGQQNAGVLAVNQLSKTDRRYLELAFEQSGSTNGFIESQRQSARLGIKAAINSVSKSDYDLSSTVYGTRALANRWLKNYVTTFVLKGESATTIAKAVSKHIRPDVPGGVGYAALRLGRTELNNAFHATAIDLAQDRPWVTGMDWHLSSVHSHNPNKTEICERYASKSWTTENVPVKPHPQCRCFVTPALVPYADFIRNLTTGKYRSWIDEAA